jgi:hypothetical protein
VGCWASTRILVIGRSSLIGKYAQKTFNRDGARPIEQ